MKATIRESAREDLGGIEALIREAFPDEDLIPLIRGLLFATPGRLSLVAESEGAIAGHIVFTPCDVEGGEERLALLGPLAVAVQARRAGLGAALIEAGCARLAAERVARICVLGDPAYYGRFGFEEERSATPPYPLPEAWRGAWRSRALSAMAPRPCGVLRTPDAWRRPSLWAP